MILVGSSDSIAASSTTAAQVNCTICGALTDASAPPVNQKFDVLYQGQLANTVTALITNSGSQELMIKTIHLFNTGATAQTVTFALNGTASSNYICTISIPGNGWAQYESGRGWVVYSASGIILTGSVFLGNGLGTPASATTAFTASTDIVAGGSLFTLPTGYFAVDQRYRWHIGLIKTAAGSATWSMRVRVGVNGTVADTTVATWTSGTNTGAIDQALIIIEARVTAIGAGTSATLACTAWYVNTLTNATGFGRIDPVPGSTAGFDSTVTSPTMHVDITMGASAVVTGVAMAEQVK